MISYLKFLLIVIVITIHLSEGSPLKEVDKELDNVDSDVDEMLNDEEPDEGPSPRAKKKGKKTKKKTKSGKSPKGTKKKSKKVQATLAPTTEAPPPPPPPPPPSPVPLDKGNDDDKEDEGTTTLPDVVTHPEGHIMLRKSDLEFLEGVAKGKNSDSYKAMSDKIYNALEHNRKRVKEQLKDNQLFKAYVKNSHNVSEGVAQAYAAAKNTDLSTFLHDWYKVQYKPMKGEIKEVEEAVKADLEDATAPTTESETTQAPKKKKKGKKKKGKKEVKNFSSADEEEVDDGGNAQQVHHAAKKAGMESYSKGHLLKDLVDEKRKGGVQHMDAVPTPAHMDPVPTEAQHMDPVPTEAQHMDPVPTEAQHMDEEPTPAHMDGEPGGEETPAE